MRTLILARPDRLGDVIITTSCLAPIKEKHPRANIFFVAADQMRPLLEGHPLLAGYIPLSADLAAEFRRLNPSAIVHLHPHRDCYFAAQRAGVPMRIGYPLGLLNRQLTHAIPDRRREGLRHEAAYNFELLQPLEIALPSRLTAYIHLPESARATLQAKLPWPLAAARFAVLNPSAHSRKARWPAEHFARLADALKREHDLRSVFIGAETSEAITTAAPGHLNLAGKTDLGELAWLLKHARALISSDTGPAHLAAAVGCPVVSIFGRTAPIYGPTRWRPLTDKAVVLAKALPRRLLEGREANWRRSFAAIPVEEVAAAAGQILNL